MWEERERWRQRLRGLVVVVGLSILAVAGWQVSSDPRALPTFLSGDSIFGDTQVDPRAVRTPPAAETSKVRSAPPVERSVGSGTGGGGGVASGPRDYRVGPSSGGREMAAGVADDDDPEPRARGSLPGNDCVSDSDTSQTATRGRQTPPNDQPCEPAGERSATPSPAR